MSVLARLRRKKEDPEIARRALLRRSGRLSEATVQEAMTDESGNPTVSFIYRVGGAE
jgi:hypothetical protein